MKRRIFSDAYIDKTIAKIDEMFERNQVFLEIENTKAYRKQLRELAFVSGFWRGWVLRNGVKDV